MTSPCSALLAGASAASSLGRELQRVGFVVEAVEAPERALVALDRVRHDLVVCPLMLGGAGASSLIRAIRRRSSVPVMVAAPHESWLEALNVGADAPMFVPCDRETFNARIEAVMAAHDRAVPPLVVRRFGRLTLVGRQPYVATEPDLSLSAVQRAALGLLLDRGGEGADAATIDAHLQAVDGDAPRASADLELEVLAAALARAATTPVLVRAERGWRLTG